MPKEKQMTEIHYGVFVAYGVTKFQLSADELELIADALLIVNPDTKQRKQKAQKLAASFLALSEYAETVE